MIKNGYGLFRVEGNATDIDIRNPGFDSASSLTRRRIGVRVNHGYDVSTTEHQRGFHAYNFMERSFSFGTTSSSCRLT